MTRVVWRVAAVMAALTMPLLAQRFVPVSPGTSTIRGRVTDRETGAPLPGALLAIIEFDRGEYGETEAGPDGGYAFETIAAGRYRVIVRHPGYVEQIHGSTFPVGTEERRLVVGAGELATGIDFAMARAGELRGRVTDENGHPLEGAVVLIGRLDTARTPSSVAGIAPPATTGTDGRYVIEGLPAGDWYVEGYATGLPPDEQVPGAASFTRTYYPGVTQPEQARPVRITAGAAVPDVDIRLARTRLFSLFARVPPTLAAAAGGLELVVSSLPPGTKFVLDHRAVLGDGTVSVHRIRPGRYVVWARAQTARGMGAYWETRDIQGDTPVIDIVLAPVGRMIGRLVAARGTLPPVDGARVIAALAVSGFDPDPLSPDDVSVAADGRFEIDGLFGPRALRVVGLPEGWRVSGVRVGDESRQDPIVIGEGQTVDEVEVVIEKGAKTGDLLIF